MPLGCAVLILLAFAAVFVGHLVLGYANDSHRVCAVTGKDRASRDGGGSDMRVYTSDCGNLQVRDAWFKGYFTSSDTYAQIQPGHTYRFHTIGYRIPILSGFPNILGAQEVR